MRTLTSILQLLLLRNTLGNQHQLPPLFQAEFAEYAKFLKMPLKCLLGKDGQREGKRQVCFWVRISLHVLSLIFLWHYMNLAFVLFVLYKCRYARKKMWCNRNLYPHKTPCPVQPVLVLQSK